MNFSVANRLPLTKKQEGRPILIMERKRPSTVLMVCQEAVARLTESVYKYLEGVGIYYNVYAIVCEATGFYICDSLAGGHHPCMQLGPECHEEPLPDDADIRYGKTSVRMVLFKEK